MRVSAVGLRRALLSTHTLIYIYVSMSYRPSVKRNECLCGLCCVWAWTAICAMQSVSVSFVCASAQQSEEMSVSGEVIDEHAPETKRLATGNTQQDKTSCLLQLLGPRSKYVKQPRRYWICDGFLLCILLAVEHFLEGQISINAVGFSSSLSW